MATGSPTLSSRQRARVLASYRGRGHRNGNLWLVYSVKENRDILLHSDRSLVHWLVFLETDSSVASFHEIDVEFSKQHGIPQTSAMIVRYRSGIHEVHLVAVEPPQIQTFKMDTGVAHLRLFSEDSLRTQTQIALRWLKALGYITVFRHQDLTALSNLLASALLRRGSGTIDDLFDEFPEIDRATTYALLVRAAIFGHITLNLCLHGLSPKTPWAAASILEPLDVVA